MPNMDITGKLTALIDAGFQFVHPRNAEGEVVAIVGMRVHQGVVDLVRLHGADDAIATRAPVDEEDVLAPKAVLWERSGESEAVIDALLELADPEPEPPARGGGTRYARGCWVADGRGRTQWLTATA
ncbi:hypothetical protein [Tamaricihabitans halophyticus]|nr:hypothetical protein [Tamaricihabitans halophyticus]